MASIIKAEGTFDLLPDEAKFWRKFRDTAFEVFGRYGYVPIVTPIFEQTDLFVRGIGEATDVVSKEMFTAISNENLKILIGGGHIKNKSRLSLRPEGTAGVVRAVAENGLVTQGGAPVKLAYAGPMFRSERPQKGRQRQFNQVGIECLGADDPTIDAEGIIMLMRFFEAIGIPTGAMRLLVNSMGCAECRPAYRELVRAYILDHADVLCEDCRRRADTNPLRAFDCKEPGCSAVMAAAPRITDHLCDDCREHYSQVKELLDATEVPYTEDYALVRGLDYYTRTVFEVQVDEGLGSQNAIGGGGRYDKLMAEIGGKPAPRVAGAWPEVRPRREAGFLHRMRRRHGAPAGVPRVAGAARRGHERRSRPSAPQPEEPVQAGRQAACRLRGGARPRRGCQGRGEGAQHGEP